MDHRVIRVFWIILSILLGAVFIISALAKLYPVELFELTFVDLKVASWTFAPFLSRLFIGAEFIAGILLVLNLFTGRKVYIFILGLLLFFCIYLTIQIAFFGNEGNCGCFGSFLPMSPLQALIKNIIMIPLVFLLYKHHEGYKIKGHKIILVLLILTSLALPFILNPVLLNAGSKFNDQDKGYRLPLEILYESKLNTPPSVKLKEGKWVLAFLSVTCEHCKLTAYKLKIMKEDNPSIPVYFIVNGKEEKLKKFYEETKSENVPQSIFLGSQFIKISGPSLPAVYMINNGIVEKKLNYFSTDQDEIEAWLNN